MPVDPTQPKFFITLENFLRKDSDPLVHFNEDDLIAEDKTTLVNHMLESVNAPESYVQYKQQVGSVIREASIRQADGKPAVLASSQDNPGAFLGNALNKIALEDAIGKFEANSDTGLFDIDGENIGLNITKGKAVKVSNKSLTLEELIFQENQIDNVVSNTVSKRMEQTTRFNANNVYLPQDKNTSENTAGTKDFVIQTNLGVHSPFPPGFLGTGNKSGTEGYTITLDQLKMLGVQMMLKASGEHYLPKDEGNGESFKSLGSSLVPGLARIGQRVNYQDFSAGNIMDKVNPNYSKPQNPTLSDTGPKKKSFGSPYNPLLPFDGFISDTAAIVSAGAMASVISGIVIVLSVMFGTDKIQNFVRRHTGGPNNANSSYDPHIRLLGHNTTGTNLPRQSDSGPGSLISGIRGNQENLLGLATTRNDYKSCVKKGLKVFFDPRGNDSRNLLLTSPNYANALLREITRDIVDIGLGIANLAGNDNVKGSSEVNAFSNNDPRNAAGTVESSLRMVSQLKSNRLIKFMNLMAVLGDAVLTGEKVYTYTDESANKLMTDLIPSITVVVPTDINLKNLHKKSRLSNRVFKGSGGTAWASNTVASMFLKTKEMGNTSKIYLQNHNAVSHLTNQNYFRLPAAGGRIDPNHVKELETQLASTYMPFYFHDLRTNEIISFHAFITSVDDGFDADYSETEAYGRLGKIYKWKNTTRTVSLSFYVVSTNPQDFDEMWFKINKLVSLTMPQYTEGRELNTSSEANATDGIKFIQPFSQTPAASPMVRMRLGDLFTTNYSKLDIARMFGVGNDNLFGLDNRSASSEARRVNSNQLSIDAMKKDMNQGKFGQSIDYSLQQAFFCYRELNNGTKLFRPMESVENIKETEVDKPMIILPAGTVIGGYLGADEKNPGAEKFASNRSFMFNGMPGSLLQIAEGYIQQTINSNPNTPISASADQRAIQNFLNSNENPIFKAFDSTAGEGMAGFVSSVKFKIEPDTWSTDDGRKAPKILSINLGFLPIFDINPGLDSNGFMIGAPYNVGKIMHSLKDKDIEETTTQETP